jgi:hypothetical protein
VNHRGEAGHREKFSKGLTTVASLQPLCGYVDLLPLCLVNDREDSKVFATLLFLSYRYNEQLLVGEPCLLLVVILKLCTVGRRTGYLDPCCRHRFLPPVCRC